MIFDMIAKKFTPFGEFLQRHNYSAHGFANSLKLNVHTVLRAVHGQPIWRRKAMRMARATRGELRLKDFVLYSQKGLKRIEKKST